MAPTENHPPSHQQSPSWKHFHQPWSTAILRWAGYGLLLLTLLDLVTILIPPRFSNAFWEFQALGAIVDRMVVLIVALALIFSGELNLRRSWEKGILAVISWGCLLAGLLLLLMVPWGMVNTVRINHMTSTRSIVQYNQHVFQAEQIEEKLAKATPEEINTILTKQGLDPKRLTPEETREQLRAKLSQLKAQFRAGYESEEENRQLLLLKNATKWNMGALLSGSLLIYFWRLSHWARSPKRQ